MRRNCNLELRLVPSTDSYHHQPKMESSNESPQQQQQQQQQQLTIFYNGTVFVCDVAEIQARAILLLATREMEDKLRSPTWSEPASPILLSQLYSPVGPSMKRSLQTFLEKRRQRIQATSPYNINNRCLQSGSLSNLMCWREE